ncbi:hypothetical protein SAMN02745784_00051 [Tissierella praeacuta DSM 18095]|uniref:Uncharacterized protein n=1 Tax=Tissierella praeacuta DSM 18095 TaxID=1123404 RepID=A0A1M4S5K6_9FIRM|nr:hypothetical protein [Tissierella praeacuta]SHE27469.1 hypothetical protein SAMN02745784_00051 [Tissierella praeacuta DSM 18095]SUP00899.1 Uncharacterised protein [Tissierella praeacuta]
MDNNILIFIVLLIAGKNQGNKLTGLNTLENFVNTMEIDTKYTLEKIRMAKKIGTYFPEQYIPLINKSILFTERIMKINELIEFMKNEEYQYIKEATIVDSNKDRLNKIIHVLQKEASRSETKNVGMIMDLIINMDTYKKMFSVLTSVINSQDGLNDPTQLMNILTPLMDGDDLKNKDKFKEMGKMMEIMKILNSPKQENKEENKKIEIIEKPSKE